MYQLSYAEHLEDDSLSCRERERFAMQQALDLLETAKVEGIGTLACIEALSYLSRLWTVLMEDLANDDNGLPNVVRADLLSVGIWILKECDAIQKGTSQNVDGLINICMIIKDGLR